MKRQIRLLLLQIAGWMTPLFVRRNAPTRPERILVIKPDHLGDMLMATPPLRELRRRFPEAHISALVGPWAEFVLQGNNALDSVHTLVFPGFERQPSAKQSPTERLRSGIAPYITLISWSMRLRAQRYDAAILLRDDHWWGAALALLAGIPRRVGYAVPECRPLLSDVLAWNPDEHVTIQGLRLVAALANDALSEAAIDRAALPTEAPRVPGAAEWAENWLQAHGVVADERLVVIHPGTGGQSKLWLPERWSAVGDALRALPNVRLLVTGGPGEEALVAAVADGMTAPPLTLSGTATVVQLAALLGRAALVLGVDSGPLHLAVAAGAPTIHLYGPGDDQRFGPWGDPGRQVVLRADLFCSPCGVFTACPRGTNPSECMTLIAIMQVAAAAKTLLERATAADVKG